MTLSLRMLSFAAIAAMAFATPGFAQDAMAPAADAMAPAAGAMMAGDAMAPMSDDDLKLCLDQAATITFPHVMEAATAACHDMHNGMMPGAMAPDAMAPAPMAPDAMAPMAPDAMAPASK